MNTPKLLDPDERTPIFNSVLRDVPVTPFTIPAPTKRQKHRAGKLTGQVWDALSTNPEADTSGLTVEDTQEIPTVPAQRMSVETMVTRIGVA